MGAEKLTGTAWHVERIKKEHKRPCKFFNDEDHWCLKRNKQCYRSVHCEYYQPLNPYEPDEKTPPKKINNQPQRIVVGTTVRHREYGKGIVQKVDEKTITVRFFQNGLRTVYTDTCVPNKQIETKKGQGQTKKTDQQSVSSNKVHEKKLEKEDNNPVEFDVLSKYAPGTCVIHKKYGIGTITKRFQGDVTVEFEEFGEKTIQLDHCIKEKLLSILPGGNAKRWNNTYNKK